MVAFSQWGSATPVPTPFNHHWHKLLSRIGKPRPFHRPLTRKAPRFLGSIVVVQNVVVFDMMDCPSQSQPPSKFKFACVRCAERKVKCDRQDPCHSCVKHNAQCIFRAPKPSRRRKVVKDALLDERLKRYEAVLVEKGIDPSQVTVDLPSPSASAVYYGETKEDSSQVKLPDTGQETAWQLPTPASTTSGQHSTTFEPKLHQGQKGRCFVDK